MAGLGSGETTQESLPYPVLREISVLKSLTMRGHANISFLRGIKLIDGDLYRFYDYVSVTMYDQLNIAKSKKMPAFSPAQTKSLFKQLLSGLCAMHSSGIVHRNLKPRHLLLDYSRGADRIGLKISDFALVRTTCLPARDFTPDQVTLWYRPPEILMGERLYDSAVDIWSAGCIFGELFQGFPLFRDKSEIGLLFKIFKGVGTPEAAAWERLNYLPNYNPIKFPKWPGGKLSEIFNEKTANHMEASGALDLLQGLLNCDPRRRLQAYFALKHKFFDTAEASPPASPDDEATSVEDGGGATSEALAQHPRNPHAVYHKCMQIAEQEFNLKAMQNKQSRHVKSMHRSILVDWLIEIVDVFDLSSRTAHLAMAYLDRYFTTGSIVDSKKLQLIGATCLQIASKCEDIQFISTKDLAFCGDNTYKLRDIVDMERK